MTKPKWYRWHSLAGFPLAVLLCFIMFTGTLAVMSDEFDWLSNSAIRVAPTDTPADWPRYYRAALAAAEGDRIYALSAPVHQRFAASVLVYNTDAERYRIFVDPDNLTFTGKGSWYNWRTSLRQIHRHLMMPLNIGLPIVTLTAFPLLLSLISGLILHPNWWRGLWRWPRPHNPRVFWGDLHRLSGLWSSWLLAVISITGIWYFAEKYGLGATYPKDSNVLSEQALTEAVQVTPEIFDQVIAQAQQARPDLQIKAVFLPVKPGQSLRIEGQAEQLLVRDRANNLIFDPVTGELLSQRFAEDLSVHVRISKAADPLHFGVWGGYWSKVLYFVFGLLLTSLSVTGTIIYAQWISKWRRSETPGISRVIITGLRGSGKLGLLCTALLLICAALTRRCLVANHH